MPTLPTPLLTGLIGFCLAAALLPIPSMVQQHQRQAPCVEMKP
jgi:hypothetical protein